jgi:molybdopterin-guanine dinucleotide biosynthesis protein A
MSTKSMSETLTPYAALVLAGSRPGGDLLAKTMRVTHKALIPIEGKPMLLWVLQALSAASEVGRIAVCGLDAADLAAEPELQSHVREAKVVLLPSRDTPSLSVLRSMQELRHLPLLVTTADHPLLTSEMTDYFCREARRTGGDVAVGLTLGDTVRAAYPQAQRTFLRFRDASYRGCNLFAFLTAGAERAAGYWTRVEQDRKRPWRMIRELGPTVLLRFLLHRLSLADAVRLVSERMGVEAHTVLLPWAEAGLDVDNVGHLELVTEIARARRDQPRSTARVP